MEQTQIQKVLETKPMDINLLRQQAGQLSQKERDKIRAQADELTDGLFSELFPVKRRGPREKRWMPEHLPVGTLVEAKLPEGAFNHKVGEYVVMETRRNGPRSFVLQTDSWNKELDIPEGFNTSWITRVLKRGGGGPSYRPWVKTHTATFPDGTPRKTDLELFMQERHSWIGILREQGYRPNVQNSYVHYSTREVLERMMEECNPVLSNTDILDGDRAAAELYKQTFTVTYPLSDNYHGLSVVVVNKKRAKAWFKRNLRKLLINTRQAEKRDDEETHRLMVEDFDADFDRRYPEPVTDGSAYSEFDQRDWDRLGEQLSIESRELLGLDEEPPFDPEPPRDDDGGAGDERFALAP